MILAPLLTVVLASLARLIVAQDIVYDAEHNATSIVGTWSSQSNSVTTGPEFVNPAKLEFTYPRNTGISYSFSEDGFYEIARYRFNSNGSEPTCIQGLVVWVHGTYELRPDGSIFMVPFTDGFQQVQDPCAAVSNFIETYNQNETFVQWRIFQDPSQGYKLHLFKFDGAPEIPQYLRSTTPIMHPTRVLRNDSWVRVDSNERRSLSEDGHLVKRSSAFVSRPLTTGGVATAVGVIALVLSPLLL